jgi:hypothetical protein
MPKLKYQSMLDDEEVHKVPVSNTYTAKPKIMRAQGLQSLQDLIRNIEIEESKIEMDRRFAEAEARSEARAKAEQAEQAKPKRKYVRNASIKPHPKKFGGVKEKALVQALLTLQALGCSYKILTADGKLLEQGSIDDGKTRRHRRTDREYGSLAAYYKPFIENLQVGGTAVIPFNPEFQPEDLRSSVTARMASSWGKGSYTTMFDKSKNLEIFRIK